jgi:hypothetical protein
MQMTRGQEGMSSPNPGGSSEVNNVDLSAEMPTSKAHESPLRPVLPPPDEIEFSMGLQPDGVSASARARVGGGLHLSVEWIIVWIITIITVVVVSLLCRLWDARGWAALTTAVASGTAVLAIGLIRTSAKRKPREPDQESPQ